MLLDLWGYEAQRTTSPETRLEGQAFPGRQYGTMTHTPAASFDPSIVIGALSQQRGAYTQGVIYV